MKKSKPKRSGVLNQPIPPLKITKALLTDNLSTDTQIQIRERTELEVRKLSLLLAEYNIDSENPIKWFLLAWHLAKDYEPGFQEDRQTKKGRPGKWTFSRLLRLNQEFYEIINGNPRKTVANAASILAKKEPWKSFVSQDGSDCFKRAESLRKQYNTFRRTYGGNVNIMSAMYQLIGNP